MKLEILNWLVMILSLLSYYLIGNKKSIGFILGFLGSIGGLIYFIIIYNLPLLIMYICFAIINARNYFKWIK